MHCVKSLSSSKSVFSLCKASVRAAQTAAAPKVVEAKKTPLYELHVDRGAKMVEFAGWMMPVSYESQSITESHLHTRKHVSVFDVSHMLQFKIHGNDRFEFWESVCVSDAKETHESCGALSVLTNEAGGIIDDTVWMNTTQGWIYVVANAACAKKDTSYLTAKITEFKQKGKHADVAFITSDERALIAVQGPEATRIVQPGLKDSLDKLGFLHTIRTSIYGFDQARVTRCGYTGEDGLEISCLTKDALPLCEILLRSRHGNAKLAGLGARDSLRLEAGLCLYGNDIDATTTPIEAGLAWTVGARRRVEGGFPGADKIIAQIKNGVERKRVGLVSVGAPLRKGYDIVDPSGNKVGTVTSGCPSPSVGKNIAMGYVSTPFAKVGTPLDVIVRGKATKAEVIKMPFVPTNYFHGHSPNDHHGYASGTSA